MRDTSDWPYTVRADRGVGEFLWHTGNLYSLMDVGSGHPEMSDELFDAFCRWAEWYMSTEYRDQSQPRPLDWDAFNAEGMRLAVGLKREMGDAGMVVYAKAYDDPTKGVDAFTEIPGL